MSDIRRNSITKMFELWIDGRKVDEFDTKIEAINEQARRLTRQLKTA